MLPDFTRISWSSPRAQAVWGERVSRVSRAWEQIERLSVLGGLRSSALQFPSQDGLVSLSAWAASHGLYVIPLAVHQAPTYRVAIATPAAAMRWPDAWAERDDDLMGRLLGFPGCCRKFFARTWGAGLVDTTWEMGPLGTAGPREANILLRWLGVRAVTHLPCSFECIDSAEIGKAFIACGRQHGFSQEMDWLEHMLDWPVEWSALHGIAEIVTPVCRIQTRTNHSDERQVIRREGKTYPAEGARGVRFPFRQDCSPVKPLPIVDPREWTDNGFKSKAAMDAAHAKLLAELKGPYRCVLDLGCGNGALLQKIAADRRVGVEADDKKALRAFERADYVYPLDCTNLVTLSQILSKERPDLIIAQAVRNPVDTFAGVSVLSYSYEPAFARLIQVPERVAV